MSLSALLLQNIAHISSTHFTRSVLPMRERSMSTCAHPLLSCRKDSSGQAKRLQIAPAFTRLQQMAKIEGEAGDEGMGRVLTS